MSNNFCKEATRPFRPILKALAASNDNWDGFFETVSLSTAVGGGAGGLTSSAEAGFAVDKNGDVACFYSVCAGVSTEVDPDAGVNVNLGISSGTVDGVAGTGMSVGLDASLFGLGGGFGYDYGTDKSFQGIGFSLDAAYDSSSMATAFDFSANAATCTTTAQVVKYSKGLASLDINPYYYDSADTCRKV